MPSSLTGSTRVRQLSVAIALALAAGGCARPASDAAHSGPTLDEDGVQRLFAASPGSRFRLGTGNPNKTPHLVIERSTPATSGFEGGLRFWKLPSHALSYASGGTGWTSRLHIRPAESVEQLFTWRTQHGYLLDPQDLKNQEFTVFIRVHGVRDPARAQVSLKIRGGSHTSSAPERASCVMLTLSPISHGSITRFGKELTHPDYDYKTLAPAFPAALEENAWVGLKLVSWNDPLDAARVINRLYLDTDPFEAGRPRNNWRLFSEYVDIEGVSTGRYAKLVDWGGWQTTLRTDGFESLDFAFPSVREIDPPEDWTLARQSP